MPAWGSTAACPIFAAPRASGGPIRPTSGSGSTSSLLPTPAGSTKIQPWPGDSTATGWACIDERLRTRDSLSFAAGRGEWIEAAFVFTSNVDGHFQRAGFAPERIVEVHGSFDGMQCTSECGVGIFPGGSVEVEIDVESMRAILPLPACTRCGALARPNILMFGDWGWDSARTETQMRRMAAWLDSLDNARLVVVECGAGRAIPTVRVTCENITRQCGGT